MDRNEKARREFQAAQMRRSFMDAYSAGAAKARDKTGTPLEVGQLVIWNPGQDILYWKVTEEGPALDLPQPAVKVMITISVPLLLPPGGVMSNLLIVGRHDDVAGKDLPDVGGDAAPDEVTEETPGSPLDQAAARSEEGPSDAQSPRAATDPIEDD